VVHTHRATYIGLDSLLVFVSQVAHLHRAAVAGRVPPTQRRRTGQHCEPAGKFRTSMRNST
jgi:hypothetical protein